MFNRRMVTILKRELRERLFSKSFILMTILIPVFLFIVIGVQALLMAVSSDEKSNIEIISENNVLTNRIREEFSQLEFVKSGLYTITYKTMSDTDAKNYLKNSKQNLLQNKLTGIIFISSDALKDKRINYYSTNPNNNSLFQKLREPINKALVGIYFNNKNLSSNDIGFASRGVDINGFRITKAEKIEEEGYGNLILFFLLTLLLYFSLIFIGSLMMRSVLQEKTNRVVEVLLSSVNGKELMTGKILGTAIMGVAQMFIWLIPVIILITTTWFVLPPEINLKINMNVVWYFLFNAFIGLMTFLGLFAAVGSIFDNDQDSQSGMWPVMMLIMIPFFIALTMQNNANTAIVQVSSLIPFASIIVMPARTILIDVPLPEILLSVLINILTMVFTFWLAGKVYRVGILMTGKKPKWSEVVKWVKYKY